MKIIAISDTHSIDFTHKLKGLEADLLVCAGDMTNIGTPAEILELNNFFDKIKHQFRLGILLIAGNHDRLLQIDSKRARSLVTNATYLENESIEIEGIKFWGSPQQPFINDYWVFGASYTQRERLYKSIPEGTDVVITHGAPDSMGLSEYWGCSILRDAILKLKPQVHIFGHIHRDVDDLKFKHFNGTKFYNVSMCNNAYRLVNEPTLIEITK